MFGRKWILHHDYFLLHTAPSTVLENPLHPPDLYDFSGSQSKISLKGFNFESLKTFRVL
jgi:hypothetical protein